MHEPDKAIKPVYTWKNTQSKNTKTFIWREGGKRWARLPEKKCLFVDKCVWFTDRASCGLLVVPPLPLLGLTLLERNAYNLVKILYNSSI